MVLVFHFYNFYVVLPKINKHFFHLIIQKEVHVIFKPAKGKRGTFRLEKHEKKHTQPVKTAFTRFWY